VLLICLIGVSELNSQTLTWSESGEPRSQKRHIIPSSYKVFSTNFIELKSVFQTAPDRTEITVKNSQFIIEIPAPTGELMSFRVVEHTIMAAELQAQFPNIRTFAGQGMGENGSSTARFDYTTKGFHAQIIGPSGSFYIDPYSPSDLDTYIVYTKDAFYENTNKIFPDCNPLGASTTKPFQIDAPEFQPENSSGRGLPDLDHSGIRTSNGSSLRQYDLALACTGEYASFHGGTIPEVMSAFTTSMNRINGVFIREMSLEMIMVDNTDELIFLNSSTDPYTNNDTFAMLDENQETCDDVIGSSNYDIGHVFATGGGGVAYLQSACNSFVKAGGVSSLPSPVGDPFDIDYVSHEFGHQWGGNHTQNNSCNRSSSDAFEPGSASTIMGYAGICPPNLQTNSDDYFHNHSFNEMYNFSVIGSGNSCATTISSGNIPPSVIVPDGGFFIPVETPFELTATGADSDGGDLTYCWEQYNLGPATSSGDSNLDNPSGNAPIFRSWNPVESPTRVFPRISDLVNNTTALGETLPTYTRDLTFRCTVRDNDAGGGGVVDDQVSFDASDQAGPFLVIFPNTSFTWLGNSTQTVFWDVANTDQFPVNCSEVDIFLSIDGGFTYPITVLENTANDGSASIIVPNIETSSARIKIKASENIFFDISDENFTIEPGTTNDNDVALLNINNPSGTFCGAEITPEISILNSGSNTLTSLNVTYGESGQPFQDYTWNGSLATGQTTSFTLPPYTSAGGDQTFSVILLEPNGVPDEDVLNNSGEADYNAIVFEGEPLPFENDFQSGFPGTGWTNDNPDNDIGWESDFVADGSDCTPTTVASINFYNYNSQGEADDLISPWIDLSTTVAAQLTFDYAYARYNSSFFDRMQVQLLNGCDGNWITLWDKENLDLATAGSSIPAFTPDCGDWSGESIDLSSYAGEVVKIRFRGITGWGNDLYLDNILIEETSTADCSGTIDGDAFIDECGECVGGNTGLEPCEQDCAGEFGGDAYVDECGVCDDNPANDNETCEDCAGVPNGDASIDECGICAGGTTGIEPNESCTDCNGVVNGSAFLDNCNECVGGNTGLAPCEQDCAGEFGGDAYVDECGVCDDNPANDNETCEDCAGVPSGEASIDECGICAGGTTGIEPNESCTDCNGVVNGSAFLDNCNECVGGNTGLAPCEQDCAGEFGGDAYVDECGVCDDNPANDNTTCGAIVNGILNSSALCSPTVAEVFVFTANTADLIENFEILVDPNGDFQFEITIAADYDIFIKVNGHLQILLPNQTYTAGINELGSFNLIPGDINNDNAIDIQDFSIFSAAYGLNENDEGFNPLTDINCDGVTEIVDFSIFSASFPSTGVLLPLE